MEESKPPRSTGSVRLDTGLANDGSVFPVVPDDQLTKLIAAAKVEAETKGRHTLLDVGTLGGLAHGLADARDDLRPQLGRRSKAKPVRGVESRNTAFGDRRHLRQHRIALLR